MEIANASKQKKREGLFSTFPVHLLKTHLCTNICVTTAGSFKNENKSVCVCFVHYIKKSN